MSDVRVVDASEILEVLIYTSAGVSDDFLHSTERKELEIFANVLSIDPEGLSDDQLEDKIAIRLNELRREKGIP
jgi:hypothetical protein